MRILFIFFITIGILFAGIKILQIIKFDAAVLISVRKGPFKGLSMKLLDYKVSYNDLQVKHHFWESALGQAIFKELSTTLQTLVLASKKYVDIEFNINYAGLLHRHYKVIETDGNFDIVAI